ncbi:NAD-dependent epimerase/dehydratase family protein [Haloarcula sp. CBA1130]|uniref:NAD-dependent epimerase/dehydratase family protein n=1 Tax=unclassified Haloarcula TaxID=2624677 RepID=UPI001244C84D|nr:MULTISPECIES: NAD-dependent epimerase/dehydratase family protein [unclassified Haloarcula]KAA9395869.1 NAD-dependent epimerase/dehydratase family protein [Haloarcula sp. CBA1129]KAA9400201.1 NAD-dependent epimerase/dehydratase family protein [Haloarcula sp. CBA1130]
MSTNDVRNCRVLVTGGAGFIGSHLTSALAEENHVRVLDDFSTGQQANLPENVTVIEGDIRERDTVSEAMDDVDIVFHEAAMVSVPESIEQPVNCHEVNGSATVTVFDCARQQDARVVLASSAAVYGNPDTVPIKEAEPTDPRTPYGIEKHLGEQYARFYTERYGLPTVPLRYFNVYGPRGLDGEYAGVIGTFIRQAQAGNPLTIEGDGKQTRDFVYVDDVVRANLLAATTDTIGRPFNVGTGRSVSINELAKTVRDVVGADVAIKHVPERTNDIRESEADLSDARTLLGYEPTVPLRRGLESTLSVEGK